MHAGIITGDVHAFTFNYLNLIFNNRLNQQRFVPCTVFVCKFNHSSVLFVKFKDVPYDYGSNPCGDSLAFVISSRLIRSGKAPGFTTGWRHSFQEHGRHARVTVGVCAKHPVIFTAG